MDRQQQVSGYLYYIKIQTNLGIFYKIGFTSYQDINDRFNYNGSNDYKLIKEVLMFKYYEDAYYREQKLHSKYKNKKAFSSYSNIEYLPLAGNGQSELYFEDVLFLDVNYSKKETFFTKLKVNFEIFKSNLIPILVTSTFIVAVVIETFPYSLIFILIIYVAYLPPEQTYNIFSKLWNKFINKISKKVN